MLIPAILLAAGASRRLGQSKQLLRVTGASMISHMISILTLECAPVLVVLGFRFQKLAIHLDMMPVNIIYNKNWNNGISSSICAGIERLPYDACGVLFCVCDQVMLNLRVIDQLIKTIYRHPMSIVTCKYNGARGVPSYFPAKYFFELQHLHGAYGAKHLLYNNPVIEVAFNDGWKDIDYPCDLQDYFLKYNI